MMKMHGLGTAAKMMGEVGVQSQGRPGKEQPGHEASPGCSASISPQSQDRQCGQGGGGGGGGTQLGMGRGGIELNKILMTTPPTPRLKIVHSQGNQS